MCFHIVMAFARSLRTRLDSLRLPARSLRKRSDERSNASDDWTVIVSSRIMSAFRAVSEKAMRSARSLRRRG